MSKTNIAGSILVLVINLLILYSVVRWIKINIEDQRAYEGCNVSMSDDEIKDFTVKFFREEIVHINLVGSLDWSILERTPLHRHEAESEFEMVKYEVTVTGPTEKVELLIGRCRDVINFAWKKQ